MDFGKGGGRVDFGKGRARVDFWRGKMWNLERVESDVWILERVKGVWILLCVCDGGRDIEGQDGFKVKTERGSESGKGNREKGIGREKEKGRRRGKGVENR